MITPRCAAKATSALRTSASPSTSSLVVPLCRRWTRTCQRGFAYHSYALPKDAQQKGAPPAPRNDDVGETAITKGGALPRVHETRPPREMRTPPMPASASAAASENITSPNTSATSSATATATATTQPSPPPTKPTRPRSRLRPRKAAMTLTPSAVTHLRQLLDSPTPKLIKVGVRNRGCSGLAYHLEYVEQPGAFDETVEQDGVRVLIDSKALFSIIGSEMDWAEDKLNQRFVFKNPNISKFLVLGGVGEKGGEREKANGLQRRSVVVASRSWLGEGQNSGRERYKDEGREAGSPETLGNPRHIGLSSYVQSTAYPWPRV